MTTLQNVALQLADLLVNGVTAPADVPPEAYTAKWRKIAKLGDVIPYSRYGEAEDVMSRLLMTRAAQELLDDLVVLLKHEDGSSSRVLINVMTRPEFPEKGHDEAAGYLKEEEAGEREYHVYLEWQPDARASDPLVELRKGVSTMAQTLFHELLHVWFLHKYPGDGLGHEWPAFKSRERNVVKDLKKLEAR